MDYMYFMLGCPPDFKQGHTDAVRRVVWSKSGNIVSCSDDRYATMTWRALCVRYRNTLTACHRSALCMGRARCCRTIKITDGRSTKVLFTLVGHRGPVLDVDLDETGDRIASSSADGTTRIWNSLKEWSNKPMILKGHRGWVCAHAHADGGWRTQIVAMCPTVPVACPFLRVTISFRVHRRCLSLLGSSTQWRSPRRAMVVG